MGHSVVDLFQHNKEILELSLAAGDEGLKNSVRVPEVHRPGVALLGYFKYHAAKRILVFGKVEMHYLKDLDRDRRNEILKILLKKPLPAVILSRGQRPLREMKRLCDQHQIPLFVSKLSTSMLLNKLGYILGEIFAESHTLHGTLVELFGVGVLLQGSSSVGKSEAALSLLDRGHRLIADDAVRVKKREGTYLEGECAPLTKHYMEIRGIGIINVAHIYGPICVGNKKTIDIVVMMEPWDDGHFYDRVGLEETTVEIQGVSLPFYILPVKPGRDVALLLETIVLNHRLKQMGKGYHSAQVFHDQLTKVIEGGETKNRRKNYPSQSRARHPYKARH
jgi:HPr kinase/phosphorylase